MAQPKAPEKLIQEIQTEQNLKHVETADKSAPAVPNPNQLMSEIAGEHKLKHVTEIRDTSTPKVEGATLQHNQHKELFTEISGDHQLKHVTEVRDASAPVIPADVQVKENPMKNVLKEIKKDDA